MSMPARPMTIYFEEDIEADDGGLIYRTLDISECVSIVSRKAYRQGLEWAVSGIRVNSPEAIKITVATLPQTWVMSQAWKTGYRSWKRMQRDAMALDDPDAIRSAYSDFKIAFDRFQLDSALTGYSPNMQPFGAITGFGGDAEKEWAFSEYNFPDDSELAGVSRLIHAIGPDASGLSVALIHNYANLRRRPVSEEPNVPLAGGDSAFNFLFDYGGGDEPTITDLITKNDKPPYWNGLDQTEEEYYPGGKNYRPLATDWTIGVTNIYNSGAGVEGNGFIPGFTAYCGLVRLIINSVSGNPVSNIGLWLDLMPGPHDGYMARPMQEVN